MEKVAVVTGASTGIGFAIVKRLCQQFDGIIYLTARDVNLGTIAVQELEKEGLKPKFHQLDITNTKSIETFRDYLQVTHGGLDILINNAVKAFKICATEPLSLQAEVTLHTNYFGLRKVCSILYPLLKPHARVVHLSSNIGMLSKFVGIEVQKKLCNENLTEDQLDNIMQNFIDLTKTNAHQEAGWSNSAYVVSKIGICALARIQQRMFNADSREDIVVNAVNPGYIGNKNQTGQFTLEEGTAAPIFCALLPEGTDIKGKFICEDKTVKDWESS